MMKIMVLIGFPILLLLQFFDVYSTSILIERGATEINPFMEFMMSILGVLPGMIIVKGCFLLLLCYVVFKVIYHKVTKREMIAVTVGIYLLNVVYAYFMYTHNYQYLTLL